MVVSMMSDWSKSLANLCASIFIVAKLKRKPSAFICNSWNAVARSRWAASNAYRPVGNQPFSSPPATKRWWSLQQCQGIWDVSSQCATARQNIVIVGRSPIDLQPFDRRSSMAYAGRTHPVWYNFQSIRGRETLQWLLLLMIVFKLLPSALISLSRFNSGKVQVLVEEELDWASMYLYTSFSPLFELRPRVRKDVRCSSKSCQWFRRLKRLLHDRLSWRLPWPIAWCQLLSLFPCIGLFQWVHTDLHKWPGFQLSVTFIISWFCAYLYVLALARVKHPFRNFPNVWFDRAVFIFRLKTFGIPNKINSENTI